MELTDTHTHPYYSEDAEGFVRRAIDAGVTTMVMPNVDLKSVNAMQRLRKAFPENLYMAMGLHPTEVKEDADVVLEELLKELGNGDDYVAVGEVGIDLYWDKTFREKQMQIFEKQLQIAQKLGLPTIIHCREALDETLEVLQGNSRQKAVFHSFGGTRDDVERIMSLGENFYFGINGIVTFKNSGLKDVIPAIPSERILLETDSPYLAPVPFRGKTNESAYLTHIAQAVASACGCSLEEIARKTQANAKNFFRF